MLPASKINKESFTMATAARDNRGGLSVAKGEAARDNHNNKESFTVATADRDDHNDDDAHFGRIAESELYLPIRTTEGKE
jgi:hypothetical protein